MTDQTCATCRWWVSQGNLYGYCHGAPPQVTKDDYLGKWPVTSDCDFCAAWKQKPPPKKEPA